MIVDMEKERLKKIKQVKVFFSRTQCRKCGRYFIHEKMWKVPRWGVNKWKFNWFYCMHCFSTPEEVLNQVDNDGCMFGIYGIDPYPYNPNKRNKMRFSDFPDPDGHPVLVPEDEENDWRKRGRFSSLSFYDNKQVLKNLEVM